MDSKTNPVANKIMNESINQIQAQLNNQIISTVNGIFGELINISSNTLPKINHYESERST
jgi:hypothetical protein